MQGMFIVVGTVETGSAEQAPSCSRWQRAAKGRKSATPSPAPREEAVAAFEFQPTWDELAATVANLPRWEQMAHCTCKW